MGWVRCACNSSLADCCISAFQTHKKRVCYTIKGIMCKAFNHLYGTRALLPSPVALLLFFQDTNWIMYNLVIWEGTHYKCRETNIIVVHAMIQVLCCVFHTTKCTYCMIFESKMEIEQKKKKEYPFLQFSRFHFLSYSLALFLRLTAFINIFVFNVFPFHTLSKEFRLWLWGFFVFLFSFRFQRAE